MRRTLAYGRVAGSHRKLPNFPALTFLLAAVLLASVDVRAQSSSDPIWSESSGAEDFEAVVASFIASSTPMLEDHYEAGAHNAPATLTLNASGASLLVAWVDLYGVDPVAPQDTYGNTWQPLTVYSNGTHGHGRLYYAYPGSSQVGTINTGTDVPLT
jgi:hypothetical protein